MGDGKAGNQDSLDFHPGILHIVLFAGAFGFARRTLIN
jgi:hypothetical protein